MNEAVAQQFCKNLRVLEELLKDRSYQYTFPISMEEIRLGMAPVDLFNSEKMQDFLTTLEFEAIIPPGDVKAKFYFLCGKVSKSGETVNRIKEDIESLKPELQRVIIVLIEGSTLTPPTVKDLQAIEDIDLEIFDPEFLALPITRHILQPEFKVLSEPEKEMILETYMASEDQMPGLLWNDPIRRWFGLEEGQIISILRPSEGGETPYYRIVKPPDPSMKKK